MKFVLKLILVLALSIYLPNYGYASDDIENQDNHVKEQEFANLFENNKMDLYIETGERKGLKDLSSPSDDKTDSKDENSSKTEDKPDGDKDKKANESKKRNFKIEETFIITDKTRANTLGINSEKEWTNFKDKLLITYDILGQEDSDGELKTKRNRFEFNYKLYAPGLSEKEPFLEYCYSSDRPTRLQWKVLSGGIGKKLPFDVKFDIGYGYKWGKITEEEVYKYDVVTINLNNKKKISNFTLTQNLKTITPRSLNPDKQPIYDYKSSLSTPISKNINGTINFDWRYQKMPELKKEDWFNYTLKFGLTFFPRK